MKLYIGIDLHSSNNYIAILDEGGKKVFKKRLANDFQVISEALKPYRDHVAGIAVESTYNWYWLVDGLMEEGYPVHLANPSAMKKYAGLKYTDDKYDAFWLADLLRLDILPQGYIYPPDMRPVRDLLRKRQHLVRLRTSLILSLKNIITRNTGNTMTANNIKQLREDQVHPVLAHNQALSLAGGVSKSAIDFLTQQITRIESFIEKKISIHDPYKNLLSIPGVGKIVALTIILETGPISRFAKVGNYVSYCRKVASAWVSNEKTKGKGTVKNGNKYLAWGFSEAAEHARRFHEASRTFYNRKLSKKNLMIAHNALAHKLARAAYYIMRDNVGFEEAKLYP